MEKSLFSHVFINCILNNTRIKSFYSTSSELHPFFANLMPPHNMLSQSALLPQQGYIAKLQESSVLCPRVRPLTDFESDWAHASVWIRVDSISFSHSFDQWASCGILSGSHRSQESWPHKCDQASVAITFTHFPLVKVRHAVGSMAACAPPVMWLWQTCIIIVRESEDLWPTIDVPSMIRYQHHWV